MADAFFNNLEFGVATKLGYSRGTFEYDFYQGQNIDSKISSIAIGIYCNKYFGQRNIKPFIGYGIEIGNYKETYDDLILQESLNFSVIEKENSEFKFKNSFSTGFAFFISETISIDLLFNYNFTLYNKTMNSGGSEEFEYDVKEHIIYFGTGINIFIPLKE